MNDSHHARLVFVSLITDFVLPEVEQAHEVSDVVIDRFGIDDARTIISQAYQKPVESADKILVVRTNFITHEAQNALLKVLEEPPVSTRFYFVVPTGTQLLPTLRSRLSITHALAVEPKPSDAFAQFLGLNLAERLQEIEMRLKKKDLDWQREMKQGLLSHIHGHTTSELSELEFVARYFLTRGASNKLLLEHLALVLPVRA